MASVEQREAAHPAGLTSLEIFDKFKSLEDDKDSDEESFHLPLLESEEDTSIKDSVPTSHQNGETEDEILNKFDCAVTSEVVDPKVEDSILNEELEGDDEAAAKLSEDQNGADGDGELPDIPKVDKDVKTEDKNEAEKLLDDSSDENKESEKVNEQEDTLMDVDEKVPEETTEPTKIVEENLENDEKEAVNVENKTCDEKEETNSLVESKEASIKDNEGADTMEVDENAEETENSEPKPAENETATPKASIDDVTISGDDTKEVANQAPEAGVENKPEVPEKATEVKAKDGVEEAELKTTVDEDANESSTSDNLERDDLLDISVICDVDEDNAKAVEENTSDGQTSEKSDNEQDDKPENDIEESENDETQCSSDKDDAMEFEEAAGITNSNLNFDECSSTNDNVPLSSTNDKQNADSADSSENVHNKEDTEMVDVLPKVMTGLVSDEKKSEPVPKTETEQVKTDQESEQPVLAPADDTVEYLDLDKHMAEQKKVQDVTTPTQSTKRSLPLEDLQDGATVKKIRLAESIKDENKLEGKTKTLTTFESFMRTKVFNKKLTKSDLEQFCVQKICEAIMHKSAVGDLQQTVKKQEQIIETLRKDLQQLTKQARDLDIVNKKLINELKGQNGRQKPLVPLKITRSVGLQVKLNVGTEPARKRGPVTPNRQNVPPASSPSPANRSRVVPANTGHAVVRQVVPNSTTTRKQQPAPGNTPILSQALQTPNNNIRQPNTPVNTPKRAPVNHPKSVERPKPSNPGVIDLTDEDDRAGKPVGATPIKVVNKQLVTTSKLVPAKPLTKSPGNQAKVIGINQIKANQVGNKGTTTRTVTTLPQGVRLTPTGSVKNGIAIPANVVTSSTGGPQLMYVVQPTSSLVTSTAGGGQKTVLLNFQPGNGILTSALNGSAVSVIPTKAANVQIKPTQGPRKHPAALPLPPPVQLLGNLKPLLPKPHLSIRKTDTGIILQWRMPYNLDSYECIASYQLFAYQETNAPPSTDMWRKVGDVKALALPMACTLTQFADKNKYYFAVRSVDVHKRIGAFSDPEEISL